MTEKIGEVAKAAEENVEHFTERVKELIPKRHTFHQSGSFGARAADKIASAMGSWRFIIGQTCLILLWALFNVIAIVRHWDPYPFILLNLLFSTQAAYAAPIIMMSQNRQSDIDHVRDDHEAEEVDLLFSINQKQLSLIQEVHRIAQNQQQTLDILQQHLQADTRTGRNQQ